MQEYKRQMIKFSLLQWFFWSSWAIFGAYIVYYLIDMGYSNIQIGAVISVRTFTGLIGEPILGYLSDIYNTNKKLFILGIIIVAIVVIPFPYYNWWLIIVATAIIGFFWVPQQSLLDSWILKGSEKLAINYGFMRAWGSLGYATVVVIFGKALDVFGWGIFFISHAIILTFTSIIAFYITAMPDDSDDSLNIIDEKIEAKERKTEAAGNSKKACYNQSNSRNPMILFKNTEYTMILISSILVLIPCNIIFIYMPNFIKDLGGTKTLLGIVLFLTAGSESLIFFFGKKMLVRFKPIPLLLVAMIFYLIRVIIVYEAVNQINFLVFGVLHSMSFGILLITARFHINSLAPANLKTTAQSVFTMAIFGVGGIIASFFGGFIMDYYGMTMLYHISIILSLMGILLMTILYFYRRLKKTELLSVINSEE